MKSYRNLYSDLCSYDNLMLAFKNARKRKTQMPHVKKFEKNLKENIKQLRLELLFHIYKPESLTTFIIRDPKTRKISKSDFRDRIVHHAICNIIEPIFEKSFIYDSFANRKGKGTLAAIKRFDKFKRKLNGYIQLYKEKELEYDNIYNFLEGWFAYAKNADTFHLRNRISNKIKNQFVNETSTKEINRYLKNYKK